MGKQLINQVMAFCAILSVCICITSNTYGQNKPGHTITPPVKIKPAHLIPPPPKVVIHFIEAPFDSVKAIASRKGLPIFVFFYSAGCDHCEREMATTLTNKPLADTINKYFIATRIESGSDDAKPLLEKYNIHLYPSFILFDKTGLILHMEEGELPVGDLFRFIKKVNTPNQCLFVIKRDYDSGNHSVYSCYNYAMAAAYHDKEAATKAFREYFNLQNDPITIQRNWALISKLSYAADLPGFQMLLANKDAFAKIYSDTLVNKFLYEGALESIAYAADKHDSKLYDYTRGAFANCADTAYLTKYYEGLLYYWTKMQRRDSFVFYADKGVKAHIWNDGIYLVSASKRLLEMTNTAADYNRVDIWLNRAMQLIPRDCRVYEAKTRLLIRLGRRPEAIEMVKKGIEVGKESDCDLFPLYGLRTQLGVKDN